MFLPIVDEVAEEIMAIVQKELSGENYKELIELLEDVYRAGYENAEIDCESSRSNW